MHRYPTAATHLQLRNGCFLRNAAKTEKRSEHMEHILDLFQRAQFVFCHEKASVGRTYGLTPASTPCRVEIEVTRLRARFSRFIVLYDQLGTECILSPYTSQWE